MQWTTTMAVMGSALLRPHAAVTVGPVARFDAADAFRPGAKIGGRTLSIGWSFARHFLGTVETGLTPARLQLWSLAYAASDAWIAAELSKASALATPLAHIHRLMDLGDDGPCRTDGSSNFAYSHSATDGRLWAIHWFVGHGGAWVVGAAYVPHPAVDWRAGSLCVSAIPIRGVARGL